MTRPQIEILYFEGCPNHRAAAALVGEVADELGLDPDVRLVEVRDTEAAEEARFLGSPTVRVDGRDVEPGSEERGDFALACRVYPGPSGVPPRAWIEAALARY